MRVDSTISHIGFLLLSLSICSVESLQAFLFYLTQYTISNLNAFFILIAIGFSLHFYKNSNKEDEELKDKKNSPIQLISQLRGYFFKNAFLSLSFAITIFSFAGIPPLIGFFGKQMVLSAALDKGYIFMSLVAIITSVIGAVYYLNIIKEIFFYPFDSKLINILNPSIEASSQLSNGPDKEDRGINSELDSLKLTISSYITITISTLTLILILFIVENKLWLSMVALLANNLFNT